VRVVIDGIPITGASLAIIIDGLLGGWVKLGSGDELHVVTTHDAQMSIPDGVHVHWVDLGRPYELARLRAQNFTVPRICRQVRADAMLGVLPTTTIAPLPCPRAIIVYDLRHEQRLDQFTPRALRMRTWSYNVGIRQADAIIAISERTRGDLLRSRSWLDPEKVGLGYLAADHADSWPKASERGDYAIAFGHYVNKNVGMLLDAWAMLRDEGEARPLQLFGIPDDYRSTIVEQVARLKLGDLVTPLPWLAAEDLHARFAGAGLVVFPSDFEGFGMPAAEAMRLEIPLVISPDPALVEVANGHASVMAGWTAADVAEAVKIAWQTTPEQLSAAKQWADQFTWSNMAVGVRKSLQYAISHR
jgi:glycosyltransferase involved in cell wall biosynthesis